MDVRQIGLKWTEMEQSRRKWGIGTFYHGGRVVKAGCFPRLTLSSWILILRNDLRRKFRGCPNFYNHPAAINANLLSQQDALTPKIWNVRGRDIIFRAMQKKVPA